MRGSTRPDPHRSAATGDSEPWRPQFHYSPEAGRLADPNGLVWVDGTYHLFHQSDGRWAHASSTDLLRWRRLPIALDHDQNGQALSGSAVSDPSNRSGLVPGGAGVVAVYTSTATGEAQSVALSQDGGATWNRYPGIRCCPTTAGQTFAIRRWSGTRQPIDG